MFTDLVGSTDLASALDPEDWHDVLDAYQHRVATHRHRARRGDRAVPGRRRRRLLRLSRGPGVGESRRPVGGHWRSSRTSMRLGRRAPTRTRRQRPAGAGGHPHGRGARRGRDGRAVRSACPTSGVRFPTWRPACRRSGNPGQIVISGDTADLVAGFFELESLGSLTLKGIGHPVPAFRVLQRGERSAPPGGPAPHVSSFRGPRRWTGSRSTGIACEGGSGRLVLVSGEPGIGKSRLLLEFGSERRSRRPPSWPPSCAADAMVVEPAAAVRGRHG